MFDDSLTDDLVAQDAFAALAGHECRDGGGTIDPQTGTCEEIGHLHCPFCDENACLTHQVASSDDDNGYSGPDIPFPPRWLGDVGTWPDQWIQVAFGDLDDMAGWYADLGEEGERKEIVASYVFESLARRITERVVKLSWSDWGLAAGGGDVLLARDPQRAMSELDALLDRLRQGFQRLADSESGVEDVQRE